MPTITLTLNVENPANPSSVERALVQTMSQTSEHNARTALATLVYQVGLARASSDPTYRGLRMGKDFT